MPIIPISNLIAPVGVVKLSINVLSLAVVLRRDVYTPITLVQLFLNSIVRSKSIGDSRGSGDRAWRTIFEQPIISNDLKSCNTKNMCMHVLSLVLFMCYEWQLCIYSYNSGVCLKFNNKPKKPSNITRVKYIRDRCSNE